MNKLLTLIRKYNYILISIILIILNIILLISVHNLNLLTLKYYIIIFGVLLLLEIISIIFILIKPKFMKIIGYIFIILLIILMLNTILMFV